MPDSNELADLLDHFSDPSSPPAIHFVGFRTDSEYWAAVKVWGRPGFIHMRHDTRMRREMAPGDVVVFARGSEARPADRNASDLIPQDPENGV